MFGKSKESEELKEEVSALKAELASLSLAVKGLMAEVASLRTPESHNDLPSAEERKAPFLGGLKPSERFYPNEDYGGSR